MKTVLQELKEKLQEKVNNPMSIQIECDIFQRVVDVIDEVYFEKEKEQIEKAFEIGYDNGACVSEGRDIYHGSNYYNETFKL